MFALPACQYTRKIRARHFLLCAVLAAGGLPAHAAAPAAASPAQTQMDVVGGDVWSAELEFYMWLWWEILHRWPPPTMPDDLGLMCDEFNEGYATVGIRDDLTQQERQDYIDLGWETLEHLAAEPELPTAQINQETSATIWAIMHELGAFEEPVN